MLASHDTEVMGAQRPFRSDEPSAELLGAHQRRERPARILIADDEYLIANDLAFTLTSRGFGVVGPVTDGHAALDRARRELPDLALLDIRLPGLDGLAAARELTNALDIPCIILSGYSDPDLMDAAGAIGISEYLIKPVAPEQLCNAITLTWRRFCRAIQERQDRRAACHRFEEQRQFERAAGALVSRCGVSEEEARRLLHECPRDSRRSITSLADEIIRARSFGR